MEKFLSILYIPLNVAADEKIAIGLLMCDGVNLYFKYSPVKLELIKGLLSEYVYDFLVDYLTKLESYTNSNIIQDFLSHDYIIHLSKHSNNIITFSVPRNIDDYLYDNLAFLKLFDKLIWKNK